MEPIVEGHDPVSWSNDPYVYDSAMSHVTPNSVAIISAGRNAIIDEVGAFIVGAVVAEEVPSSDRPSEDRCCNVSPGNINYAAPTDPEDPAYMPNGDDDVVESSNSISR